jgi:hypothetical protein
VKSKNSKILRIFFLSIVSPDYSRSSVLLNYQSDFFSKIYIPFSGKSKSIIRDLLILKNEMRSDSAIVIMSPSHKLTFFARILTRSPIVLDAGWPLTDGVVSRGKQKGFIGHLVVSYLLDFVSFHSAHRILLESKAQSARVRRIYFVSKKKIHTSFTGFNETSLTGRVEKSQKIEELEKFLAKESKPLVVLFRGKINRESGIESILNSAKELGDETSFIIVTSAKNSLKNIPLNCFVISDITQIEMSYIYSIVDIALGQLSTHPRLKYTIPHKAFEAGFFAKSYLSYESEGIKELFPTGSAYLIDNVSVNKVVASIRDLSSKQLRDNLASAAHARYKQVASQRLLNANFESIIREC